MKHSLVVVSRGRFARIMAIACLALQFTACKKDKVGNDNTNSNAVERYRANLPSKAVQELNAARSGTQRYRSIDSAKADGYADINVIVENMGFHLLKASLADTTFDPQRPEILVYNKQHDGSIQLVAVEYAVPIPLMPNKSPEGFTGSADVWTYSTVFNLWLLHAWVWEYNPYGVFVPNNPNVHLH